MSEANDCVWKRCDSCNLKKPKDSLNYIYEKDVFICEGCLARKIKIKNPHDLEMAKLGWIRFD